MEKAWHKLSCKECFFNVEGVCRRLPVEKQVEHRGFKFDAEDEDRIIYSKSCGEFELKEDKDVDYL